MHISFSGSQQAVIQTLPMMKGGLALRIWEGALEGPKGVGEEVEVSIEEPIGVVEQIGVEDLAVSCLPDLPVGVGEPVGAVELAVSCLERLVGVVEQVGASRWAEVTIFLVSVSTRE